MVTRSNNGDKLEAECKFGLLKYFGYSFKFPDTRVLRINKQIKEEKIGRELHQVWAGQMPSDFYAVRYSMPYLIECKSTIDNSIPFSNVKQHQVDSMKKHADAGGKSILLFGFYLESGVEIFAVNIYEYLRCYLSSDRKSLTVDFCRDNFIHMGREQEVINDKKVWIIDFSNLF
jgi:penicillin-binding protein-related factor A (putative recombinase)